MNHIFLLAVLIGAAPTEQADVLIKGAMIYDGSGQDGFVGDIAIKGDAIVAVGQWPGTAKQTIDAKGLVATPGLIDLHTHSDFTAGSGDESLLVDDATRDNYNYTSQGCTTVVTGNCGAGVVDVGAFFDKLDRNGVGSNVIHLLPHGDIRERVFGSVNRPPTDKELKAMKALIQKGMEDGAWGISTGLWYPPSSYAKTDEIIELTKVVGKRGGIHASHIRSEGAKVMDAVKEVIHIAQESDCPVQISHLKCSTKVAWGKMGDVCGLIEAARAKGIPVTADQYPYTASQTGLESYTTPAWAREGGYRKLVERLDDPGQGKKIRKAIADTFERYGGPDRFQVAICKHTPEYNGKNLAEIAKAAGKDPVDLVVEIIKGGKDTARMIAFSMQEDDLLLAMKKPFVATASDGAAAVPSAGRPHPRYFGTFPRKIGYFAIQRQVIPLAFAIRSASGLPADVLGLSDRGYIRKDCKADLLIFDPETFRDKATFKDSNQYSTGAKWVFVNGVAVIADGKKTGKLPGKALRLNRDAGR
ncbi:MAG: D-aminoacylase [Planctomycetes bacterium]|nr:D-aminoacylase [Planctomycetota bacterium]MBL7039816.1 D-aminoacylase [Pirellulaceae bacterium]